MSALKTSEDVLRFWFEELSAEDHFKKSEKIDSTIRERFLKTIEAGARGELFSWRKTAMGRLAEILVLDQFSRNVYRGLPASFAQDAVALTLAQEMHELGLDAQIPIAWRSFVYMPYMHSESKRIHEEALRLFDHPEMQMSLKFELLHKVIIDRFGRYPHRNEVLGRVSTPDEIEFLKTENSSF